MCVCVTTKLMLFPVLGGSSDLMLIWTYPSLLFQSLDSGHVHTNVNTDHFVFCPNKLLEIILEKFCIFFVF